MKNHSLMAGASRFAHFAGLTRSARGRAADDDDQRDDHAEDEDDKPKGKRSKAADDDRDEGDEPKGKKSRRAADDDDAGDEDGKGASDDDDAEQPKGKKSKASDDDDDADEEPKARGKKSRRAAEDDDDGKDAADDEDDDDKGEMTGRSSAASARRRERARCAAIFGHKSAANNVALAASLAFDTTMTRQEAIAVMRGQADRAPEPQGRRSSRESRNADLSSSDEAGGRKPKTGSSWGGTFAKLGITPKS